MPHSAYDFFQGFEVDVGGWLNNGPRSIHREPSGFTDGYGSGIASSGDAWHARLRNSQTGGCAPPFSSSTFCTGPFTRWGKATSANAVFPTDGYVTGVDFYLDVAWASANTERRFDFSSAINKSDGTLGILPEPADGVQALVWNLPSAAASCCPARRGRFPEEEISV